MLDKFDYKLSWKREYKPVQFWGYEKETISIRLTLFEKETGKSQFFNFKHLDLSPVINENDLLSVINDFVLDCLIGEYPDLVKENKVKKRKMNTCKRLYNKFHATFSNYTMSEFLDDINLFISEEYYHKQSRKLKVFQKRFAFDSGMLYFTYNKI